MMELTKHIWFCEFLKSFFFKEKVPVYKAVYSFYYHPSILLVLCLGNQSGSLDVG